MNATLGKKRLIKDISANTLQTVITQLFGLLIFYITSKYLLKDDFGEFNWCMAVGSTLIAVSSLGLDLVFVKRIALGGDVLTISGIHFFHTVIAGSLLSVATFVISHFMPSFRLSHPFFLFVLLNLAIANIANSFKLCLNGLEAYRKLAILSLCTNVIKFSLVVALYLTGRFTILNVIAAYMLTSFAELIMAYVMMGRSLSSRVKPLLRVVEHKYFILESLPQLGVVLFDSALARIDWILLGIISTAAATAEYSFAYKIFELSKLPLLIIAPVLLTRFSKLFSQDGEISESYRKEIGFYFRLEMFVLMFIPIVLVVTWTPLIDYFTNNKYGAVNEVNYMILAACVPLHGIINFLWTIGFVQGQLKTIFFITITVSVLNIAANALFIPLYGAQGSSLAFLLCTLLQVILYLRFTKRSQVNLNFTSIFISFSGAIIGIVVAKSLINNSIFATVTALIIYSAVAVITRQINFAQIKQILLKR